MLTPQLDLMISRVNRGSASQARAHADAETRFSRSYAIRHGVDQGFGLEDNLIGSGAFDDLPELGA